ncbi:pirin family protein [Enhygromyxa salina]|uniref:Quercetin 2,3-dioxygenase n=1 Tax=Enhygromyxa salina TaxID=215803 RepID=A0A2S9YC04_9BACT|nr:pirin family protein [Enhygromyxa salina]PRQ02644.1 Quercetin 2,3-dioxygenase [Enhygromyxa salina]
MTESAVIGAFELGPQWPTFDPFLFCVHHDDRYPAGDDRLGPKASLEGRKIGMDFAGKDGWRMYHGDVVPGFPQHPHRGFETVTLARRGYIDHSDSLGAKARFGHGDCQWMTAGRGIVHSEMFPLINRDQPNPTELFQIWLNLPSQDKLVDPYFTMLWEPLIPKPRFTDANGRVTQVAVVAGQIGEHRGPPPPPSSWAARPDSDVAIWTLRMQPGAIWTLPAAGAGVNRTLYFFAGGSIRIDGANLDRHAGIRVRPEVELLLENGDAEAELLVLQGRPIDEPVAQHGPFVMNTREEIQQAMADFRRDGYGGWPWASADPVHGREQGRFAVHADGREEVGG